MHTAVEAYRLKALLPWGTVLSKAAIIFPCENTCLRRPTDGPGLSKHPGNNGVPPDVFGSFLWNRKSKIHISLHRCSLLLVIPYTYRPLCKPFAEATTEHALVLVGKYSNKSTLSLPGTDYTAQVHCEHIFPGEIHTYDAAGVMLGPAAAYFRVIPSANTLLIAGDNFSTAFLASRVVVMFCSCLRAREVVPCYPGNCP